MKVVLFRRDEGAVGHNRIIWPAEALRAQGHDVTVADDDYGVVVVGAEDQWGHTYVTELAGTIDADVVVMQLPLRRWRAQMVPLLEAAGIAVVVEVDDDYEALGPRNEAWCAAQPDWFTPEDIEFMRGYIHRPGQQDQKDRLRQLEPLERRVVPSGQEWLRLRGVEKDHHRGWLRWACQHASLVTCTTSALAERYSPDRAVVVPNCVPAAYLDVVPEPHDGTWVGWSGSTSTHRDDLEVTRGGVARAVESTGAGFAIVGEGVGVTKALGLRTPSIKSGWVPLSQYPGAVAQLDVGIVPLADTRFSCAKSALKMTEMAALGVPCVVSPTPDNVRMHREGIGVLAARPRHWEAEVRLLVQDNGWRAELAQRGREAMRRWTYEARCGAWLEAWEQALTNHRARKVAA